MSNKDLVWLESCTLDNLLDNRDVDTAGTG